MKALREAVERLSGRFDFKKFQAEEKRAERSAKAKRPPKRRRR